MEVISFVFDYIWVPMGAVLWHHNSRIKGLESADVLTYREFTEEMNQVKDQLTAIAIQVGVAEERRHDKLTLPN